MTQPNKKLIVVIGPTAVGKTDLCIQLAKHYGTEIISADSRQLFQEMSIGTAKPSIEEMQGIPHHFVDSHSIHQDYNAGQYERDVLQLLDQLFQQYDKVILTGGSGMYIKAVCEGLDLIPDTEPKIREELNQRAREEGLEVLVQELQRLDPVYYSEVDHANTQRVIRGLEVCLSTGQAFSSFRKKQSQQAKRPFQIIKIGLNRNREELYNRINRRMDLMIEDGLLEEVKALLPFKNHNALQTVGYREIFAYLDGEYDWEECQRLLKRNTRHYAKRQLTWFGKDKAIHWCHPSDYGEIIKHIDTC